MVAVIIIIIILTIKIIHIFPGRLSFIAFTSMGSIRKYFLSFY